jgi:hypothetical protein
VEEERENSKQPAEDHFWILHINYIGLKVKWFQGHDHQFWLNAGNAMLLNRLFWAGYSNVHL